MNLETSSQPAFAFYCYFLIKGLLLDRSDTRPRWMPVAVAVSGSELTMEKGRWDGSKETTRDEGRSEGKTMARTRSRWLDSGGKSHRTERLLPNCATKETADGRIGREKAQKKVEVAARIEVRRKTRPDLQRLTTKARQDSR